MDERIPGRVWPVFGIAAGVFVAALDAGLAWRAMHYRGLPGCVPVAALVAAGLGAGWAGWSWRASGRSAPFGLWDTAWGLLLAGTCLYLLRRL